MTDEEFEKIFGNTPFENIQKIKKYINIHFVPYEQYISKLNELNKKWEDKIKAKIEEYDDKGMTIYLGTRSYGKTFQQVLREEIKKVLQSLLEKE